MRISSSLSFAVGAAEGFCFPLEVDSILRDLGFETALLLAFFGITGYISGNPGPPLYIP